MKVLNKIARWWQGRGFGIQSRTDYEYLKDVIKESLPYYAYDEIKTPRARLIYRICLYENHEGRQVTLTGVGFTDEEVMAAKRATPCSTQKISHLHGQQTVLMGGINTTDLYTHQLWQQALASKAITWDMGSMGLVRFLEGRYAEHYAI